MYKSESAFSKVIVAELRKYGMVQRIESGLTGRGIPDIYFRNSVGELWIELKNSTKPFNGIVPWRAGQQAWAYEYRKATALKKSVITLYSCLNKLYTIPMHRKFIKNTINKEKDVYFSFSNVNEMVSHLIFNYLTVMKGV